MGKASTVLWAVSLALAKFCIFKKAFEGFLLQLAIKVQKLAETVSSFTLGLLQLLNLIGQLKREPF